MKSVDDRIGCLFGMKETLNFTFSLLNKSSAILSDSLRLRSSCMNSFFSRPRSDSLDCKQNHNHYGQLSNLKVQKLNLKQECHQPVMPKLALGSVYIELLQFLIQDSSKIGIPFRYNELTNQRRKKQNKNL